MKVCICADIYSAVQQLPNPTLFQAPLSIRLERLHCTQYIATQHQMVGHMGHMVGGRGLPGQTRMPESPGHKGSVLGVRSIATLDALTINSEATSHIHKGAS